MLSFNIDNKIFLVWLFAGFFSRIIKCRLFYCVSCIVNMCVVVNAGVAVAAVVVVVVVYFFFLALCFCRSYFYIYTYAMSPVEKKS